MPNDEDGLLTTLADFGRDHSQGDPQQGTEDGAPGGDPIGQVGFNGPPGGGITPGGGYTGGGGGGGGGGPGGGTPKGPAGGGGDKGGTPGDPGGLGPIDGGDHGDGDKPCVLHCDPTPGPTPPAPPQFYQEPGGPKGDTPLTSAVPEPATWMMLILGFGALGSALRGQRRKARQALA
jgi:hypothetical protein